RARWTSTRNTAHARVSFDIVRVNGVTCSCMKMLPSPLNSTQGGTRNVKKGLQTPLQFSIVAVDARE
ncbi:hypothetical protein BHE74_00050580, partial [Ensete ventricosum]